jgi:methyl coenzyme M reductase gamma subunit
MTIKKNKQKRDWSKYIDGLVNRGKLTLFITKDFADTWYVKYNRGFSRTRGGQAKYTETVITSLLSLRFVFKLPLRAMEGLAKNLVTLAGLDIDVPDYSTLSIKLRDMKIKLPPVCKDSGGGYVASLDSTGVKIQGQGEWNRKKHSQKDRRQWVKVHLIIDNDTMQILGVEATADDVHDSEVFDQLIDTLPNKINKVLGDGAYDILDAHKKSSENGIELVALPRGNAVVDQKSTEPHILKRNEQVAKYKENGIYAWANKYGYWPRNRSESTMSRFKTTFTGTLSSRKVKSQKNEIVLKCKILNIFAALTVPTLDNAA